MTSTCYGQAYQRGYNRTVRFLLSRGARADSACEAAQAAWARGWERIGQLRNEDLVITWVNTIALNHYKAGLRNVPGNLSSDEPSWSGGIDLAAMDVKRLLVRCRPQDRELFQKVLEGATTQEIANRQGVTETAIRLRLMRAKRATRALIAGAKAA
jgi:DNA-directed RNA polymerase specialized sigma24 family protein